MKKIILSNGLDAYTNLVICIGEGTATARTFEVAIKQEGLTMDLIKLISNYYKDDIIEHELKFLGDGEAR